MATNIEIDPVLVSRACKLGGHATKRAAITCAVEEYVARLERERLIEAFGTVDFREDYDYKEERRRDTAHREVRDG